MFFNQIKPHNRQIGFYNSDISCNDKFGCFNVVKLYFTGGGSHAKPQRRKWRQQSRTSNHKRNRLYFLDRVVVYFVTLVDMKALFWHPRKLVKTHFQIQKYTFKTI